VVSRYPPPLATHLDGELVVGRVEVRRASKGVRPFEHYLWIVPRASVEYSRELLGKEYQALPLSVSSIP
jgi:hypothetical protein